MKVKNIGNDAGQHVAARAVPGDERASSMVTVATIGAMMSVLIKAIWNCAGTEHGRVVGQARSGCSAAIEGMTKNGCMLTHSSVSIGSTAASSR